MTWTRSSPSTAIICKSYSCMSISQNKILRKCNEKTIPYKINMKCWYRSNPTHFIWIWTFFLFEFALSVRDANTLREALIRAMMCRIRAPLRPPTYYPIHGVLWAIWWFPNFDLIWERMSPHCNNVAWRRNNEEMCAKWWHVSHLHRRHEVYIVLYCLSFRITSMYHFGALAFLEIYRFKWVDTSSIHQSSHLIFTLC